MTEISTGFEEYKNKITAYPPNCQTDFGPEHGDSHAYRNPNLQRPEEALEPGVSAASGTG